VLAGTAWCSVGESYAVTQMSTPHTGAFYVRSVLPALPASFKGCHANLTVVFGTVALGPSVQVLYLAVTVQ
jgi:hypothetical protein